MSSAAPLSGATRYLCPLECGWSDTEPALGPPSLADLSIPQSMTVFAESSWWAEAQRKERVLFEHLATHTTEQFVRRIQGLRAEVAQLRGAGPVRADEEPTP
ncbi:hypothetical protein [Streptomyces sp. NPDC091215]|uniref:hypothetical protein n=1 Tax=Streptomyces sp. NPDC091215 TaxID=3155192 RepID=UPI003414FDEE